jgi:uncharacterized phage protein gp47/JayE
MASIITAGEEEETDEDLRTRFYAQVQSTGTSGNKHDYRNWALEVPGCGDAKVYPTWNGSGTVKVLVVDEDMAIDLTLPAKVGDYIENVRPIGATVTVDHPTGVEISITANVKLDGTSAFEKVQAEFTASLTEYLKETVFDIYNLSYAKIGSMLLATVGVQDYNSLSVNGGTANVVIGMNEMPICGAVTLTEV